MIRMEECCRLPHSRGDDPSINRGVLRWHASCTYGWVTDGMGSSAGEQEEINIMFHGGLDRYIIFHYIVY